MAEEFRSIRDNLWKVLSGFGNGDGMDDEDETNDTRSNVDASAARALLQALFAKAGKSKDEVVQIVAREFGMAVAAMLKEPLAQLAKHQKLQISFELVPKNDKKFNDSNSDDHSEPLPTQEKSYRSHKRHKRPKRRRNLKRSQDT